jgi:hypothetical protein
MSFDEAAGSSEFLKTLTHVGLPPRVLNLMKNCCVIF